MSTIVFVLSAAAAVLTGWRQPGKRRPGHIGESAAHLPGMDLAVGRVLENSHDGMRRLHDLNRDVQVRYEDAGNLEARAGDVVGVLHWQGRNLLGMNFSTGVIRSIRAVPARFMVSLTWAAWLTVLGGIIFPLLMLISPLVWSGRFSWGKRGGLYGRNVAPGTHKAEACLTYIGGVLYAAFAVWCHQRPDIALLSGGVLVVGVSLFVLHRYVLKRSAWLYEQLLSSGVYQLKDLYEAGRALQASPVPLAAAA